MRNKIKNLIKYLQRWRCERQFKKLSTTQQLLIKYVESDPDSLSKKECYEYSTTRK